MNKPPSWTTNRNKLVLDEEEEEEDEHDGGEELAAANALMTLILPGTGNFLNTPNPVEPQVHTLQLRNDTNPEFATNRWFSQTWRNNNNGSSSVFPSKETGARDRH
ncbi:hypothetical protein GmHk_10G027515 [Glycine max]|nr:hypothetical protein GmHk_10G027515 [Glycine max]